MEPYYFPTPTHEFAPQVPIPTLPPLSPKSLLSASSQHSYINAPVTSNTPTTISFSTFPINIYIGFRDGVGRYQLSILDSQGRLVRTVFEMAISNLKEFWASWDGTDQAGKLQTSESYYAVLSKDGRLLRKIVLSRINP
jgi:hypothetical protein